MPLHPLTNFEIQRFYPKESHFHGASLRNNLAKKR